MSTHDLPAVNAALNALSLVLLVAGFAAVRRGKVRWHRRLMLMALVATGLFLVSYSVYHAQVGSTPYPGVGAARGAYLALLASHVILAVAIVPLVLVTVRRALGADYQRHKRIARRTLPLWIYVSVTGVAVYVILYVL